MMNEELSKRMQDVRKTLTVSSIKKYAARKKSDITSISIHHSLTQSGNAESLANYQTSINDWPGIGYTYVIKTDGIVQWCHDYETISYHVGSFNTNALGICFVGDFRSPSITRIPNDKQLDSAFLLLQYLEGEVPTAKSIMGHCQYNGYSWKECPGFDMNWFRDRFLAWKDCAAKQKIAKPIQNQLVTAERRTIFVTLTGKPVSAEGLFYEGKFYLPISFVENLNYI